MPKANQPSRTVVIWRFSDGKRGHDNQSLGLVEALSELMSVDVRTIPVTGALNTIQGLLFRRLPATHNLAEPDLIVGAGHATHWPMLAARWASGGRIVVLMRPSLPGCLFDLCIVPRHDGATETASVIVTDGALNRVRPSAAVDRTSGLILLGGESSHYVWDGEHVLRQVRTILEREQATIWQIADSRRTPASLTSTIREFKYPNAAFVHHQDVNADWLRERMSACATIWVTEDSVSMLYEALSTRAAVGLLQLPERERARVGRGIADLLARGYLVSFEQWQRGSKLITARAPLQESLRCAHWIQLHWQLPITN